VKIEKEPQPRAAKRQKVDSNSVEEALPPQEGNAVHVTSKKGSSKKGTKLSRKTSKPNQGKVDMKGIKVCTFHKELFLTLMKWSVIVVCRVPCMWY